MMRRFKFNNGVVGYKHRVDFVINEVEKKVLERAAREMGWSVSQVITSCYAEGFQITQEQQGEEDRKNEEA